MESTAGRVNGRARWFCGIDSSQLAGFKTARTCGVAMLSPYVGKADRHPQFLKEEWPSSSALAEVDVCQCRRLPTDPRSC
jgi:hypothetical protein